MGNSNQDQSPVPASADADVCSSPRKLSSSFLSNGDILAEIERQKQQPKLQSPIKRKHSKSSIDPLGEDGPVPEHLVERAKGKTLRQGYLVKQGNSVKTWRKRWFALVDPPNKRDPPCLCYYQTKPSPTNKRSRPLNVILLADGMVIQTHPDHFEIDTPSRTFFLRATTPEECAAWVHAIASVLPPPATGEGDLDDDLLEEIKVTTAEPQGARAESQVPATAEASGLPLLTTDPPPAHAYPKSVFHTTPPPQVPKSKLAPLSTRFSSTILEGYLIKEGQRIKTKKRRWFTLRGHVLIYYDDHFKREPLGVIYLKQVTGLVRLPSAKPGEFGFGFELATPTRSYPMLAESPQELDSWVECLSRVVNNIALRMAIDSDSDSLMFRDDDDEQLWDRPLEEEADWTQSDQSDAEKDPNDDDDGEEEVFDVIDPFGNGAQVFDSGIEPPAMIPDEPVPAPQVAKGSSKPIPVLVSKAPLPTNSALRKALENPQQDVEESAPPLDSVRTAPQKKKLVFNTIELLSDLMDTLDDLDQFIPTPSAMSEAEIPDGDTTLSEVDAILNALEDLKQSI